VILLGFSQVSRPLLEIIIAIPLAFGKFSVDVNILAGKQQSTLQEGAK
jgi:hypothetical protein